MLHTQYNSTTLWSRNVTFQSITPAPTVSHYCAWQWTGFHGNDCRIECVSATCARATGSAAVASTSATDRRASVSTAGTVRCVPRSETAASSTRTASATGAPTPTAHDTSSAASAPTSCRRTTCAGAHLLAKLLQRINTESDRTIYSSATLG